MSPPRREAGVRRTLVDQAKLLESGKYSDLTITCSERKWRVHRSIVCLRSSFFASACDTDFQEATTGKVDLPEDDPEIIDLVLNYPYNLDYDDARGAAAGIVDEVVYKVCILCWIACFDLSRLWRSFGVKRVRRLRNADCGLYSRLLFPAIHSSPARSKIQIGGTLPEIPTVARSRTSMYTLRRTGLIFQN